MTSKPIVPNSLPWSDPLAFFASLCTNGEDCVFLHSSQHAPDGGRYSLLALQPREIITGTDFSTLASRLSADRMPYENAWFGTLSYELKHALESLPHDAPGNYTHPLLWMARFGIVYCFDHAEQKLTCWSDNDTLSPPPAPCATSDSPITVKNLGSNMTRADYLAKVRVLLDAIHRGDLYQANLTRKFTGEIEHADPIALFTALCHASPARYSAFLRMNGLYALSSSPERFLSITSEGAVTAQPIKGSAPRFADAQQDALARSTLEHSDKDKAENLMIVDLMRNDLSRACLPGSVKVENLFEVTSYATVHHMASTVTGIKMPDAATLDVVKSCFPPGSMTGAPKIRAMRVCSELENIERGIYSGALGWFGGDGSCDLSVVIRTLILKPLTIRNAYAFEFQVGGGIVADSNPESEWRETLIKARAIAKILGIGERELESL